MPGVTTAADGLPITVVCLVFAAVIATIECGMGPAGAIGRGLLVVPPPFAPRIFSTREVGVAVGMVGGGRGGVGLCDVGMVSVDLACEGNRGREMVRDG